MTVIAKRTRAQYPFVVEPVGDRWAVLFVRTDRPEHVAWFDDPAEAFGHMRSLNRRWWQELYALDETRRVIDRVRETSAPQPSATARASLWTRLKRALRLL